MNMPRKCITTFLWLSILPSTWLSTPVLDVLTFWYTGNKLRNIKALDNLAKPFSLHFCHSTYNLCFTLKKTNNLFFILAYASSLKAFSLISTTSPIYTSRSSSKPTLLQVIVSSSLSFSNIFRSVIVNHSLSHYYV